MFKVGYKKTSRIIPKCPVYGREPANGYFQFHFTAELKKKRYIREIGEEKRFIEEVYLEERDQVEDGRLVGV